MAQSEYLIMPLDMFEVNGFSYGRDLIKFTQVAPDVRVVHNTLLVTLENTINHGLQLMLAKENLSKTSTTTRVGSSQKYLSQRVWP